VHQQRLRGLDIVVVPRSGARGADALALRESLEALWDGVERSCAR
jgi:ribonuclease P protein component